jgi:hypothetical protein
MHQGRFPAVLFQPLFLRCLLCGVAVSIGTAFNFRYMIAFVADYPYRLVFCCHGFCRLLVKHCNEDHASGKNGSFKR